MDDETGSRAGPMPILRLGRTVGLVVCGMLVTAYAVTLVLWLIHQPAGIAHAPWSTAAGQAVLAAWGIPMSWWIAYLATLTSFVVVVSVVAAYLLLRGETSWFRIYLAVALVLFATAGSELSHVADALFPQLNGAGELLQGLAWVALFPLAYVFPDGRFVPSWSRWLAVAWVAYLAASIVTDLAGVTGELLAEAVLLLLLFASCVAAQIYRYVRVSGRQQRQQAKWLVAAFGLWLAYGVVLNVTPLQDMNAEASPRGLATYAALALVTAAVLAMIPTAITVAIVRYRLFEIDVWINRTLVYAVLTAFVVGAYVTVVTAVGRGWPAGDAVAPPLAAGIIALTFNPVRMWVQQRVNRLVYGERDDPYLVLSRLGQQLDSAARPETAAPAIVDAVARAYKVPYVALALGSPAEIVASVGREVTDTEAFELRRGDEELGHLIVGRHGPGDRLSSADRRLLSDLVRHSGTALYAAQESLRTGQLAADLQRVREQLVTSREEERRRIRRDLHDSLGPALGSQTLTIDVARSLLATDPAAADAMLVELKTQSQQSLAEVRQLARELRPPVLDELGLGAALAHLKETYERQGVAVRLEAPSPPPLAAAVEVAAYRIVDEALTNVVRHAHASSCSVVLTLADHTLLISVSDDGRGVAPGALAGVGTASMRERAEELGGTVRIRSAPGDGTHVDVRLPLREPAEG